MNLFSSLSDDQIALLGCAAALFVSGSMMYLSYFVGKAKQSGSNAIRNRSEIDKSVVGIPRRNSSKRAA